MILGKKVSRVLHDSAFCNTKGIFLQMCKTTTLCRRVAGDNYTTAVSQTLAVPSYDAVIKILFVGW